MICQVLQSIALAPALLPAALARRRRRAYASDVPEKEGNRYGSLKSQKRTDRATRFFYVRMPSCAFNERRWRGSLRACWFSFVHQSSKPATCRSPRLEARRGLTAQKEAHMPRPTRTSAQSHGSNDPVASQTPEQSSIHQPFSWLAPQLESDLTAQFVARTMDICHGIHACLELVNSSSQPRSSLAVGAGDDVPLLDQIETERLLRFAMASAGLLAEDASKRIQWMNKHA